MLNGVKPILLALQGRPITAGVVKCAAPSWSVTMRMPASGAFQPVVPNTSRTGTPASG